MEVYSFHISHSSFTLKMSDTQTTSAAAVQNDETNLSPETETRVKTTTHLHHQLDLYMLQLDQFRAPDLSLQQVETFSTLQSATARLEEQLPVLPELLDLADQFYRLTFDGKKTHDLGEIPAPYKKNGVFVADFGATDLKFLNNGGEDKYKDKNKTYNQDNEYMLDEPGFYTLIYELNQRAATWPTDRKLYFRAGSIIKTNGQITVAKIKQLIHEFNKQGGLPNIEEELVMENSVFDTIGRLNKPSAYIVKVGDKTKTPVTGLLPGNIVLLGGPLAYGLPVVKFTRGEMIYTEVDRKTKESSPKLAHSGSKMPFKFFYYHQAFTLLMLGGKINLETDVVLMGPTGSNPTMSIVNTETGIITVCEFVGQNFDKTADNNGYVEVDVNNPQQVRASSLKINQTDQPKLCALLN
jgi:hypothetical protein